MQAALRITIGMLGLAAIPIALSILLLGAEATARLGEVTYNALTGSAAPLSPSWPPTMDNELRFYAALWLAYGVLCLRAAREPLERRREIGWLAAVFFLGGVGRTLSTMALGFPHPFFVLLMSVELAIPPVVLVLLWLTQEEAGR